MSSNNNKQPLGLTKSLTVLDEAQFRAIDTLDYVGSSLDIPEINQPDVTTRNLSHSDKPTIGSLLDCAKRGEIRGKQPSPSICKVSRILRDHNESFFIPQLVSIGPIHREDPKLQEFEWRKECYLSDLLSRCVGSTPEETLEACLERINDLIPKIRESYADVKKNYSDDELAWMMVMDGCFILEFCFRHEEENKMQNLRIAMDLIMLENQVPFFVLQALYDCSIGKLVSFTLSRVLDSYLAFYIKLFRSLMPEKNSTTDADHSDLPEKNSTHDHVLGYLHKRYRLVAAKSSKPKLAEASKLADEEHAAKSSKLKHAKASKLANEEQATKLSNPIHADKDGTRVGPGGSRDTHGIFWCCVNFCKKPRFFLNALGPKQLCSSFCIIFHKCPGSNCVLAPSQHAEASNPTDEELAEEGEERIEDTAFHSIVELDRSGMNFKPHQEDEWSMTIKFQSSHFACLPKATLLMPTLVIDDTTELILRNFIAYEQSFPTDRYYFTSYAHVMDMHIDTQEDIAKLVESKVLVNNLGSNQEAADMINKLCKNIIIDDFYYNQEFKQVDKYYNRFWPKNIAKARRIYFSNPWSAIALVAAIILFSITVVQFVYTIIGA